MANNFPINPVSVRKSFARSFNNGESPDYASLDAILSDFGTSLNQSKARLEAISTSAGTLSFAMESSTAIVATAAQTSFVVPAYNILAGQTFILAFTDAAGGGNQLLIPPSGITQIDATHVGLPAQLNGAKVTINVFSSGNGTSQLQSQSVGQGAALIGCSPDANFISVNAQSALSEIAANLANPSYLAGVLGASAYLRSDGTVTAAATIPMGGNVLSGLGAGTAAGQSVRWEQIQPAAIVASLAGILAATYLPFTGGTMSGPIDMGGIEKLINLTPGTVPGDSVEYAQMNSAIAASVNGIVPTGGVQMYASSIIPTGFLECNGQAVSRTVYSALFANLGTRWGSGDGGTTFNVPDMRGLVVLGRGQGTGLTNRSLGDFGGEEKHTLLVTEIPPHTHSVPYNSTLSAAGSVGGATLGGTSGVLQTDVGTGGNGPHNNMQPFVCMVYIIKT